MRKYFINLGFAFMALTTVSAYSAPISKEALPPKILEMLAKKHPKAENVSAVIRKHFGQDLYLVTFKEPAIIKAPAVSEGEEASVLADDAAPMPPQETKDELIEVFRKDGHFFVSAQRVDNANRMSVVAYDNLKAAFPSYTIEQAIMIVNPNGPGEEFDLIINAAGEKWTVAIDPKGTIASKEKQ